MERCRQQNNRCQRPNMRGGCQQRMTYQDVNMGSGCNKSCNQYMYDAMPMEECPGMGRDELEGMPLAMAYVPWQRFQNLYEECEAMYHGTIFRELDLDFCGKRCEQV